MLRALWDLYKLDMDMTMREKVRLSYTIGCVAPVIVHLYNEPALMIPDDPPELPDAVTALMIADLVSGVKGLKLL
jgi:hypothetical protein